MTDFDYSGSLREMNRVMFNLGRTSIEARLNFSMEDFKKEAAEMDVAVRSLLNQLLVLIKAGHYPIVELTNDRMIDELLLIANAKDPTFLESWIYFEEELNRLNLGFVVRDFKDTKYVYLKNV